MKKIILTVAAIAGGALSGFSQGQVNFENANANGYVVTSEKEDGKRRRKDNINYRNWP